MKYIALSTSSVDLILLEDREKLELQNHELEALELKKRHELQTRELKKRLKEARRRKNRRSSRQKSC